MPQPGGAVTSTGNPPSASSEGQQTSPGADGEDAAKQLITTVRTAPPGLTPIESMFWAALPPDSDAIRQYGYTFFAVPAPVITAAVGDDYVVGPGDVIVVYLWGDPVDIAEIKNIYELVVDRDGTLFFPPVGRLPVWGQSLSQIREVFKSSLAKKYKRLETSLTLGKLREFPVYVSGFVGKPGTVVATAVDSLFDVIARAGGVLPTGSLRTIGIGRKDGSTIAVDLYDVLVQGKNADIRMREGDSVLVREIGPVVGIAGQVRRPAVYELRGEKKVADLLKLAGGALPSAFTAGSYVIRFQDQQRKMTAGDISSRSFLDSGLADGDLLYISRVKDYVENAVTIEGQVKFSGAYPIDEGRSLRSLLAKAQVLTNTNLRYARLYRTSIGGIVNNKTFAPGEILESRRDIELEPMDRVILFGYGEISAEPELRDFRTTVVVQGPVRYPGMFHQEQGLRLSSILTADQILPDINMHYARIERRTADGRRPNLTFSPAAVLSGAEDMSLEPLDIIRFFRNGEAIDEPAFSEFRDTIALRGDARYPNLYRYKRGMKLGSVLGAEQLKPSTSVYYGRIMRSEAGGGQRPIPFIPKEILSGAYDIELAPMDVISLYSLEETSRSIRAGKGASATEAVPARKISPEAEASLIERYQELMESGEILAIGEIRYEGLYGHRPGLKLSSILTAEQALPGINMHYGRIERRSAGGTRPNLTFSPAAVLSGAEDYALESLDTIRLYRNGEAVDEPEFDEFRDTIALRGDLRYPNLYSYNKGMTLRGVLRAEQLKPTTSIYYGRITRSEAGGIQKTIPFIPKEILSGVYDIELSPMDVISLLSLEETTKSIRPPKTVDAARRAPAPAAVAERQAGPGVGSAPAESVLPVVQAPATPAPSPAASVPSAAPQPPNAPGASLFLTSPSVTSAAEMEAAPKAETESDLIVRYKSEMEAGEILAIGEIRYQGIYGHRSGLTLSAILTVDQLLPDLNPHYGRIERRTRDGRRPNLTFSPAAVLSGAEDIALESLDVIRFFRNGEEVESPEFAEFRDTIALRGDARYPNLYRFMAGLSLGSLLRAEQLKPTTSLYYGTITRSEAGGVQKTIPFIPKEILSGEYDIELAPMDVITLLTLAETTRSFRFQKAKSVETQAVESTGTTNAQTPSPSGAPAVASGPAVVSAAGPQASPSAVTGPAMSDTEALGALQGGMQYGEVLLLGEVRYSGIYGHRSGLKLSSILTRDQLLPETNIYYGQIYGYASDGRKRTSTFIPEDILEKRSDIALEALDVVVLFRLGYEPDEPVFDSFPETVVFEGPIRYPGLYAFREGMKLSELVDDSLMTTETNMQYAEIQRKPFKGRGAESILTFSPEELLAGKADEALAAMDTVRFFPRFLYKPVTVSGEIARPSVVPYYPGLDLLELIRTVEFKADPKSLKARIYSINGANSIHYFDDLLGRSSYPIVALFQGDRVIVQRIEENEHKPYITVKGEVTSPNTYGWRNGLKLSELLRQAGGYTGDAYPKAMVLVRRSAAELQQRRLEDLNRQLDLAIMEADKRGSYETGSGQASIEALRIELETQKAQIAALKESRVASALGRITLDIPPTLEALVGSAADIVLDRDDAIFVPSKPSYVLVVGAVSNQAVLAYRDGLRVRDILSEAGWTTSKAQLKEAYVIRSNGQVAGGSRSFFSWLFEPVLDERIGPGDTLVVPAKSESAYLGLSVFKDIVQIITQVVGATVSTLALILP